MTRRARGISLPQLIEELTPCFIARGSETSVPSRWGRCHPHPSQTRTCRFPASGSSRERFARGGVAVEDLD